MRSFYVWLLAAALTTLAVFQDRPWKNLEVFDWDAGGYYVYLPSAFIYHDLARADSLQRIAEVSAPGRTRVLGLRPLPNRKFISKYPLGVAVGQLPWFAGAHAFARLRGTPADGFARPYQHSIMLAGLVYGLLGLWLVRKLLLRYFEDTTTAWALAGVGLGTNFVAYVSYDAAMSHAVLFMWQAALLYCTARWYETFRWRWAVGIGLFLGMAVLCRPTEALFVLVPLTWGLTSWAAVRQRGSLWLSHAGQLGAAVAVGAAVVSLQLLFWHHTTGQWLLYSYDNEGFDFLHPHILDGLFSFRKGWLLYTPLVVLMLLGVPALRRRVPAAGAPVLLLLPVMIYVTFSWGQWWYGGGFSARPLVSLYPLLALPLAALLSGPRPRSRQLLLQALVGVLIVLNLWQTWQYAAGILLYDNNTATLYFRNFFHTSL